MIAGLSAVSDEDFDIVIEWFLITARVYAAWREVHLMLTLTVAIGAHTA